MAKFSPEYKESIKEEFIELYNKGWFDQHLGKRFFGGNTKIASHYVRSLKRNEELEKGERPRSEDVPDVSEIDYCPEFLTLGMPAYDLYAQLNTFRRAASRANDRTDAICEAIAERMVPREPIPVPQIIKHYGKEELVLKLQYTDAQVGQIVTDSDSGGLETYNESVFSRRVDTLVQSIAQTVEMLRERYKVRLLEIDANGDHTEGEDIFPSQGAHTEVPRMDQVEIFERETQKLIGYAVSDFERVTTRWTWGNHGRQGKRGANHFRTNYDVVTARYTSAYWRNQKNLQVLVSKTADMLYYIPELGEQFNFLNVHGDNLRRGWLQNARARYAQYYNRPVNFLLTGHWHTLTTEFGSHGATIINGSFVGGNAFSKDVMQSANAPMQVLLGFSPRTGLELVKPIYLDEHYQPRVEADSQGVFTPLAAALAPHH
jgi:hypothetical protein